MDLLITVSKTGLTEDGSELAQLIAEETGYRYSIKITGDEEVHGIGTDSESGRNNQGGLLFCSCQSERRTVVVG